MVPLVFLVLFFSMSGHSSAMYCVCKDGYSDAVLQKNIDYACGAGADCSQISQNGPCFNPNTVKDHCNYAVNSYYQKKGQTAQACDFSGTATTTSSVSSSNSACVYPSSAGSGGTTPSTTPPSTGMSPPSTGMSPPSTGMSPPSTGTGGTTTPPGGISPPSGTGNGNGSGTGTGTGSGFGTPPGTGTGTNTPIGVTPVFGQGPSGTTGINENKATTANLHQNSLLVLALLFSCPIFFRL